MKRRVLRFDKVKYPRLEHFGYIEPHQRQRTIDYLGEAGASIFFYDDDECGLLGASFPTEKSFVDYVRLINYKPRRLRI